MSEKVKRLRVLAGPNGSGKSTIINYIKSRYHAGEFINADELHQQLVTNRLISLSRFQLAVKEKAFQAYVKGRGNSWLAKAAEKSNAVHLHFDDNNLLVTGEVGLYDAAMAADFIRYQLLQGNETFTFETVLSDTRKIDFISEAVTEGFKVYLYFVCTKDPSINVVRVANRVAQGGHDVPEQTIIDRYHKSLNVLPLLIPLTYRCYLFDNTDDAAEVDEQMNLFAQIDQGKEITIIDDVPKWGEDLFDRLITGK